MSAVTVMAVVVASCSNSSRSGWSGSTATPTRHWSASTRPIGSASTAPWVGTGTVGVVLAHEHDNNLCGAWPFANYPAKRGLRRFAITTKTPPLTRPV